MTSIDERTLAAIARRMVDLERQVAGLSRASQLSHSSIEGGAIHEYDQGGQLVQVIGEQWDGTHASTTVAGPTPPTPTQPAVAPALDAARVTWDGAWLAGAVAPMDFKLVEVHASQTSGFDATTTDTLKTTFTTERGGEKLIALPVDGTWYIRLVAVSLAGKKSPASPEAAVTPLSVGELGGTTIHYGPTDPTVADPALVPATGDLWFYETAVGPPPEYETRRWDGSAWVLVRDQGIGQALADALAAQQAADQASVDALAAHAAADDAQAAANSAQSAAAAAQTAADNAQATADGKVRTFFQAAAPTGMVAGDVGDLWFDTDDGNKMYRWDGAAWVVSDDQRISEALTTATDAEALADAKITTFYQAAAPTAMSVGDLWVDTDNANILSRWNGTAWTQVRDTGIEQALSDAAAAESLAQSAQNTANSKITAYYQETAPTTANERDLWVRTSDKRLHVYTSGAWVESQDQDISVALDQAGTAQATADSKVRIFAQAAAPTGMTAGDIGDLWIDTDDSNRMRTWDGAAWVDRRLGNTAIQPQSLVASDVIATGTVSAALLEALLVLSTEIVAGSTSGSHARMRPDGFYVYALNPEGALQEAGRFGTADNDFITISSDGEAVASISSNGSAAFRQASVEGVGSGASVRGMTIYGRDFADWIEEKPRGVIAGYSTQASRTVIGTSEYGIIELTAQLEPYRRYRVNHDGMYSTNAGGAFQLNVRATSDGSTPLTNSPLIDAKIYKAHTSGVQSIHFTTYIVTGASPITYRMLFTAKSNTSGMTVQQYGASGIKNWWVIEDIGGRYATDFTDGHASGGDSGAPATGTTTYTYTYYPQWSKTWKGDGTKRTDIGDDMVQGYIDSTNGNQKSMVGGWNRGSGSNPIRPWDDMAGATVKKIEVYLYAYHWYYNSGGTAVLGVHGQATEPASFSSSGSHSVNWSSKSGGIWITLPSGWYSAFGTGTHKGITLGPGPSTSATYYGRFFGYQGDSNGNYTPALRATFTK